MALRQIADLPGAPWRRPLLGTLDRLTVQSEALRGNPLGDPNIRPLYVYRSPGAARGRADDVASVYVLQGFTGQLDRWLAREPFEPTLIERLDALYAADAPECCPEAVVVLVDAWTSLGGSQFVNSPGTGRYADYICDELVPFIDANYPTAQAPARRIVAGKSSGGYGAMVLAMQRPDRFGALISHSGDALFEVCYQPDFAVVARTLRDHFEGSYECFWRAFANREHFDYGRFGTCLEIYALAAAYSPDLQHPGQVLLPFDLTTAKLREEVWRQWLAHDPVRMAAGHAQALRGLRAVLLEAGRRDEYHLDLGAQAFAAEIQKVGGPCHLELFDGGHGGTAYRYAPAIRTVLRQLESGPTA
jgi:pimeloyl-ACP methyl ester carboxylesterase